MLAALKTRLFQRKGTPETAPAENESVEAPEISNDTTTAKPSRSPNPNRPRATKADEAALYASHPSFSDFLPWVEYLPESQCFLLEDGVSVGAAFELTPIGTDGRTPAWLQEARDAVEKALQDSFDEIEGSPWIVQFFVQDDPDFRSYMKRLHEYVRPRAKGTALTEHFLLATEHHTRAITKPGGLFIDKSVTKLPWRGRIRRIRLVVYRRLDGAKLQLSAEQELNHACERVEGSLTAAGVRVERMDDEDFYYWLMPWFNPRPRLTDDAPIDFYGKAPYPATGATTDSLPLPFDHDFSERLFFSEPENDLDRGLWYFDGMPHQVVVVEQLRRPPSIGQITGEVQSGDARNALFDKLPDGTIMSLTMVVTPQDILEEKLNRLAKKAIGENIDSAHTREDVKKARRLIGRSHKLYRGTMAFYIHGENRRELHERNVALNNVLLAAGLQPVRPSDEIAACNSYLRWLPMTYNPAADKREWYTRLMFAQHIANLAPIWGSSAGTGNPGISFFGRGGGAVTVDPLSQLDRAMNAHMLIFGPTGSGKSATLVTLMMQIMGIYRPRLFIVEAGNSFGLLGQFFRKMGLTVNTVSLKPGTGASLAPYADARLLVERPEIVASFDEEALDDEVADDDDAKDDKRDVLGELEITARLMITGGEPVEEARMTRADRALIRHCILDAAKVCVAEGRTTLTRDIQAALNRAAADTSLPDARRTRAAEMAEAMGLFTQGFDGEMFDREGMTWPDADVTLVDLATYAREGYEAQMAAAYISLMNTVNNVAERDQYSGRPIIMITDEGHIITKNPLVAPYAVKITKMWRKLGAWFWLATQNLDDFPDASATMLNMIEWWVCLNMPPDEIDKISRFKRLNDSQKSMLLSASKEPKKFTEGVILAKRHELLFRSVPPSIFLALAMTEPEEKQERFALMQQHNCSELEAAFLVAEAMDRARGIEPTPWRHLFESDKASAETVQEGAFA